ncbi:hypothetical protein FD754_002689 [Muntiacus muntjak]|uniref:Lymphocyte antigen 86 n=1 Tax=Muntiacus muntjak TaxID=9888 RepID=A0A5N3WAN3_MUNMU|nr:hypothetical protein FD754_002689 [Muntiacus muntjak]
MKGFAAAFLIWTLLSPRRAGGEAWPTHTACRNGNLQVLYQSCGEDIEQLFLDIALFSKGLSILNFSYPICEVDLPKFSFCGRRKGVQETREMQMRSPGREDPLQEGMAAHSTTGQLPLLQVHKEPRKTVVCYCIGRKHPPLNYQKKKKK